MAPVSRIFHETATDAVPVEPPPDLQCPPHGSSNAEQPSVEQKLAAVIESSSPALLEQYFGEEQNDAEKSEITSRIGIFMLKMSQDPDIRRLLNLAIVDDDDLRDGAAKEVAQAKVLDFMTMEKKAQAAYRAHGDRFPTAIWHCCRKLCFATIAMDPQQMLLLDEIIFIHNYANRCHAANEKIACSVERRRRGIGTSTVAFVSSSREQREGSSGETRGTGRQKGLREFANFVFEVLPFLYSQVDSPTGTARPKTKLCTQAICCLLGVSRNFLYNRTSVQNLQNASEDELTSLIDSAGVRLRQRRRNGERHGYPSLPNLQTYNCGCDTPCFASIPQWTLASEYNEFIKLARQLRPRLRENRFLLNRLYCPLSNSTTRVCNRALSVLYTVSESLIADVRRVLDAMCSDPLQQDRPLLSDVALRYQYDHTHPMNRYGNDIREKVESHLDIVLRADPAGWNGASVCRVYSPEINTQDKLRKVLRAAL